MIMTFQGQSITCARSKYKIFGLIASTLKAEGPRWSSALAAMSAATEIGSAIRFEEGACVEKYKLSHCTIVDII